MIWNYGEILSPLSGFKLLSFVLSHDILVTMMVFVVCRSVRFYVGYDVSECISLERLVVRDSLNSGLRKIVSKWVEIYFLGQLVADKHFNICVSTIKKYYV